MSSERIDFCLAAIIKWFVNLLQSPVSVPVHFKIDWSEKGLCFDGVEHPILSLI